MLNTTFGSEFIRKNLSTTCYNVESLTDIMSGVDLDQIYEFAITLAKEAGEVIKAGSAEIWRNKANTVVNEKKNAVDLVTKFDEETEKLVRKRIAEKYPSHKFIGEESYSGGEESPLDDSPSWIVDPIDGTTNFVHGFPFVCISIGFTIDKVPVVGVVYNPFLDQLFSAQKGKGAYLNKTTRLPLSHPNPAPFPDLNSALIAVEMGSDRTEAILGKKIEALRTLTAEKSWDNGRFCHGIRSMGSAALNFSYVAMGCLDAYQEAGCWAWDVCAGVVILSEAGGITVNGAPQNDTFALDLTGRRYLAVRAVAGGRQEHERVINELYKVIPDIPYKRQA